MGTAIKHPVPDQFKLSFIIFDVRTLWCSWLSVRVPGCQKWQLKPVWHRMRYSCTDMATVGITKGWYYVRCVLIGIRCVSGTCQRPCRQECRHCDSDRWHRASSQWRRRRTEQETIHYLICRPVRCVLYHTCCITLGTLRVTGSMWAQERSRISKPILLPGSVSYEATEPGWFCLAVFCVVFFWVVFSLCIFLYC